MGFERVPEPIQKQFQHFIEPIPKLSTMERRLYQCWGRPTVEPTKERMIQCLHVLTELIGAEEFAGPFYVDAHESEGIIPDHLRDGGWTAHDKQGVIWMFNPKSRSEESTPWQAPVAAGSMISTSHIVGYFYPDHDAQKSTDGMIDFHIASCMDFEKQTVNDFLKAYWQPKNPNDMQVRNIKIDIGEPIIEETYAYRRVGELRRILIDPQLLDNHTRFMAGQRLEQIILTWDSQFIGGPLEYFLTESEKRIAQELYGFYEGELEKAAADEIIHNGADETVFRYYNRYKRLTDREINMAGIRQNSRVVFIGGGWMPISAIMYARAGAEVTVYEKDQERAHIEEQVVAQLGLSNKIHIICKDAVDEHFEAFAYDHYVLAAMATPKDKILNNLPDSGIQNIIVRSSWEKRHYLYEEIQGQADRSNLIPLDFHEAVDPDDILSFVLFTQYPRNVYGAERRELRDYYREMLRAYGDKTLKEDCPSFAKSLRYE